MLVVPQRPLTTPAPGPQGRVISQSLPGPLTPHFSQLLLEWLPPWGPRACKRPRWCGKPQLKTKIAVSTAHYLREGAGSLPLSQLELSRFCVKVWFLSFNRGWPACVFLKEHPGWGIRRAWSPKCFMNDLNYGDMRSGRGWKWYRQCPDPSILWPVGRIAMYPHLLSFRLRMPIVRLTTNREKSQRGKLEVSPSKIFIWFTRSLLSAYCISGTVMGAEYRHEQDKQFAEEAVGVSWSLLSFLLSQRSYSYCSLTICHQCPPLTTVYSFWSQGPHLV